MDFWSEFTGVRHPRVRSMIDSKSGFGQVPNDTDTQPSALYKRAQAYTEEKVYNGLMWMDLAPGIRNPSHMASKQPKSVPDLEWKNGVLSGSYPRFSRVLR